MFWCDSVRMEIDGEKIKSKSVPKRIGAARVGTPT